MNFDELMTEMKKPTPLWRKIVDAPFVAFYRSGDILRRLNMAWQRAYRGYDDSVLWNLNDSIAELIVPALTAMIDKGMSYPMMDGMTPGKWKKILIQMRKGFLDVNAAEDLPLNTKEERQAYLKAYKKAQKKQEESLQLFAKYFNNLWD